MPMVPARCTNSQALHCLEHRLQDCLSSTSQQVGCNTRESSKCKLNSWALPGVEPVTSCTRVKHLNQLYHTAPIVTTTSVLIPIEHWRKNLTCSYIFWNPWMTHTKSNNFCSVHLDNSRGKTKHLLVVKHATCSGTWRWNWGEWKITTILACW